MKENYMKKDKNELNETEMRDEYDFSKGVRGKHYKAYREGHTVIIHKSDGTKSVQFFTQIDGAVMLDPDVKIHFPDSESVNKALRSLIDR
jgi:ATP-dependent RNA circularization protein (DNA/RNA ligase family)